MCLLCAFHRVWGAEGGFKCVRVRCTGWLFRCDVLGVCVCVCQCACVSGGRAVDLHTQIKDTGSLLLAHILGLSL